LDAVTTVTSRRRADRACRRRPRIEPAAVEQRCRGAYSAIHFIRIADAQAKLDRCKVTVNNPSAEMIPAMVVAPILP
jgi:hypothetical protein